MDIILSANEEGFHSNQYLLTMWSLRYRISPRRQGGGGDGVSQSVIVKALPVIGNYILRIFNLSFAQGTFPGPWKQAQIIPIKKTVAPSSVLDFQPIALLCFLSKLPEKIVHDQILDPLQTGFQR